MDILVHHHYSILDLFTIDVFHLNLTFHGRFCKYLPFATIYYAFYVFCVANETVVILL